MCGETGACPRPCAEAAAESSGPAAAPSSGETTRCESVLAEVGGMDAVVPQRGDEGVHFRPHALRALELERVRRPAHDAELAIERDVERGGVAVRHDRLH